MGTPIFTAGDDNAPGLVVDVVDLHAGGRSVRVASRLDGVLLDDAGLDGLIAALVAHRDAPRLAARESAEVVLSDEANDLELVKTTAGEWGVLAIEAAFDDDGKPTGNERRAIEWFSGDGCESSARVLYAEERGKSLCEGCLEETGLDDLIEAGEDGPMLCPTCAEEDREEFARARYRCVATYEAGPCGWEGVGAEVVIDDGTTDCPRCGGEAEPVNEPTAPDAGEAASS